MAAPRKVFRIEETAAARIAPGVSAASALSHHMPRFGEAGVGGVLQADLTRIAHELDAVTGGTSQATQEILAAAEAIDRLADNLSAALKGRNEQDLALDISELVLRIFEACNFQDLIGQRVGKVMKSLAPDAAPPATLDTAPPLRGPRLDHDDDHMTQAEIDALFDA
jgi:chemotaxis protein CheZ